MTRAVRRISARTGAGRALPPAAAAARTVRDLLGSHGFKYGTAARVARRKPAEMLIQVTFDLALGLGDEPEAGAVAQSAGAAPMAKEPAYQSGFSRLGRAPSSAGASRTRRGGRIPSAPPPAACRAWPGERATSAWPW